MFYLGIDPGLKGALAVLDDRDRAQVFDAPVRAIKKRTSTRSEYDLHAMARLLQPFESIEVYAAIETVGSRPEQSAQSTFSQGYGIGVWEALLAAYAIRYVRVGPQRWKRVMVPLAPGDKQAAIAMAQRLFPTCDLSGTRGDPAVIMPPANPPTHS